MAHHNLTPPDPEETPEQKELREKRYWISLVLAMVAGFLLAIIAQVLWSEGHRQIHLSQHTVPGIQDANATTRSTP